MKHPAYTPITDGEVRQALAVLKRYPSGLTRADLTRLFGSDRRGRAIMAALTERGIAPVITIDSDYGDGRVYRLARTEQEITEAIRTLSSYRDSLEKRITGLQRAWDGDGEPQQPDLFDLFGVTA